MKREKCARFSLVDEGITKSPINGDFCTLFIWNKKGSVVSAWNLRGKE